MDSKTVEVQYTHEGSSQIRPYPEQDVYLMFKPHGNNSIFVPIKVLDWWWKGSATKDGAGDWSLDGPGGDGNDSLPAEANPKVGNLTTEYPEWDMWWKSVPSQPDD